MNRPSTAEIIAASQVMEAALRRPATGDPDVAPELERLRAALHEVSALADRSALEWGHPVTLAWLRRLTREIDRLQACWRNSMTPRTAAPRRRRDERDTDAAQQPCQPGHGTATST